MALAMGWVAPVWAEVVADPLEYTPQRAYAVQVAAVTSETVSIEIAREFSSQGWGPVTIVPSGKWQTVRIGRAATLVEALSLRSALQSTGACPDAYVRSVENTRGWWTTVWTGPTSATLTRVPVAFGDPGVLVNHPDRMRFEGDLLQGAAVEALHANLESVKDETVRSHLRVLLFEAWCEATQRPEDRLEWIMPLCNGEGRPTLDDWLEACLMRADTFHYYDKKWSRAFHLYREIALHPLADEPRRARAFVELIALSRELARSGKGKLPETAHFVRMMREVVSPRYQKAWATADLIWLENFGEDGMRESNTEQIRSAVRLCQDFYDRYGTPEQIPREWAFCLIAHAVYLHYLEDYEAADTVMERLYALPDFDDGEQFRFGRTIMDIKQRYRGFQSRIRARVGGKEVGESALPDGTGATPSFIAFPGKFFEHP